MNLHTVNTVSIDHLLFGVCVEGKELFSVWVDRSSRLRSGSPIRTTSLHLDVPFSIITSMLVWCCYGVV